MLWKFSSENRWIGGLRSLQRTSSCALCISFPAVFCCLNSRKFATQTTSRMQSSPASFCHHFLALPHPNAFSHFHFIAFSLGIRSFLPVFFLLRRVQLSYTIIIIVGIVYFTLLFFFSLARFFLCLTFKAMAAGVTGTGHVRRLLVQLYKFKWFEIAILQRFAFDLKSNQATSR